MPCWRESCKANRFCPTRVKESTSTGIISFRSIIEKRVIMATDMHVGFKVQLVVEFYIYFLWLGHSQIQKKTANTSAGATSTRPAVSSLFEAVGLISLAEAADFLLLCLFPHVWKLHLAPGIQYFFLRGSKMEFNKGRQTRHNNIAVRGLLLSVPFHISPQKQSCSCGSLCMNMWLR